MFKRGVLGAYLLSFTFSCQHDQPVGVCSGRLKGGGGGLRCGHNPKKGGLRCGSGKKGGSLPRGSLPMNIPILDIHVSAPGRELGPYIIFNIEWEPYF